MNLQGKINLIKEAKDDIKSAIIAKGVTPSGNISTYANAISQIDTTNNQSKTVTENGVVRYDEGYTGLESVTVNVNQSVENKVIGANGVYNASEGYIGFGEVTVNVDLHLQDKTLTSNGTYMADDGYDGFNEVTVDVPAPSLQNKTITENGTYQADLGYDGLGEVVVNTQSVNNTTLEVEYNGRYTPPSPYTGYSSVVVNVEGGISITGDYNVQVIDYDGTILKSEKLNEGDIFTLPTPPLNERLTFQEWSSPVPITNNTIIVPDQDIIIGAVYETTSGLSEFDITLTNVTGLTVTLNLDGTKDWGDGTSDTETSHTYSNFGDYTITCDGSTDLSSPSSGIGLFGQGTNITYDVIDYVTRVFFSSNITSLNGYNFQNCRALKVITLPNTITLVGASVCRYCRSLEQIILPPSLTTINYGWFQMCTSLSMAVLPLGINIIHDQMFQSCRCLKQIFIPEGVTNIGMFAFDNCAISKLKLPNSVQWCGDGICTVNSQLTNIIVSDSLAMPQTAFLSGCYALTSVIFLGNVTKIPSQCFENCYALKEIDFTHCTSVPVLSNKNALTGINGLCKIKVPRDLEAEWKATTNWSIYADYIVGV